MEYNFPVKYAAMPIMGLVGWDSFGNKICREKYYIVSKCFLLSDITNYGGYGKSEKEYRVLFPYHEDGYGWKRVSSTRSYSEMVEKVFDTYEDALEFATYKNEESCAKTWINLSYTAKDFDDQVSKRIQEFNDRLSYFKRLEQEILSNISLEQSNVKKLDKLIINSEGKIKVSPRNLYEALDYSSGFIVYSISPEQHNRLLTLINNQDLLDISSIIENASPILYHESEDKSIMVINKKGNVLYYINEDNSLITLINHNKKTVDLSAIDDKIKCLFTTETLEDIILSFNQPPEFIHSSDVQGPTLKKKLI